MGNIKNIIRRISAFLFSDTNREILIFLFFLFISCIFWVLETLNRDYEMEFFFPVEIVNLPENAIITSDIPSDLRVTVKDKGIFLMQYQYFSKPSSISIDYEDFKDKNPNIHITSGELRKRISRNLESSSLVSFKPDNFDLSITTGKAKRVPVKNYGTITARNQYDIISVEFDPDSVTVYAKPKTLDTIKSVQIADVMYTDLDETVSFSTEISKMKNVRISPSNINVKVSVAQLTQKTIDIPIETSNIPGGKILRIFPARVRATFQVALPLYKSISQEDFIVVADAHNCKDGKCRLSVKRQPENIKYLSIYPEEVEYLIEEDR